MIEKNKFLKIQNYIKNLIFIFRSILFNVIFFITAALQLIIYSPFYFSASTRGSIYILRLWAIVMRVIHRFIVGTRCEVKGLENLPKDQPYILAVKHQSTWETYSLIPFLDMPALILKRELMWIPLFGWYMWKARMIPIDRGSPIQALKLIIKEAKERISKKRQILIFPEGTRKQPGADPDYKIGVVSLYNELKIPVVVIAHNAGLYWPRSNFRRYPGVIDVRILPAIPPHLPKQEFLKRLIETTETECDALIVKAAQSKNPPAMPDTAVKTLKKYGIDWQGSTRY